MNKFIPMILAIVMVSGTTPMAIAEEYDLSDHPIYHEYEYDLWSDDYGWIRDTNISSERYSPPAVSNQYTLELYVEIDYDPTHIYYEKTVHVFDYCDLEQFQKYPKCR